ncbi:MAG: helix-turn-helix domain-containing protein [Chthoniobacterales bacterium]
MPWKHITSFLLSDEERFELDRMVRMLWAHPATGILMIQPILITIVQMLRSFQRDNSSRTRADWQRRQTILKRADTFLQSNFSEPFNLSNLTLASGTTTRTLQREFLLAFGMSPGQWTRCFALHRVRNLLLRPENKKFTVEAIASQCGFRHMGRFSGYYQELFGELPASTLRKSSR